MALSVRVKTAIHSLNQLIIGHAGVLGFAAVYLHAALIFRDKPGDAMALCERSFFCQTLSQPIRMQVRLPRNSPDLSI